MYSRTSTATGHQQNKQIVYKEKCTTTLNLNGSEIPVVDQYKCLGVIFDKKLPFVPHIQYLKEKCSQTLKLVRVIVHKDWGADQNT